MNHLYVCAICQVEIEALVKRRKVEIDTFIRVRGMGHCVCVCVLACKCVVCPVSKASPVLPVCLQLNKEFQAEEAPTVILCISMQWFREWENFVKGKDNGTIL